ncbi:MAG: murein biosynthesis integral membrane protein MurJ [Candidatus Pacebacteria bacterium]|nr:murein biosynthesis integral membrane protein MurJ [Candidatus Paceibacterota bacterium]
MKDFFKNNSRILLRPQKSIFSAATIIMLMMTVSRVLGLIRNRILAHYFSAQTLSIYFAAFRLPEIVFEVLVLGTLASAFIPVFTSYLSRGRQKEAWRVAAMSFNLIVLVFIVLAGLVLIFTRPLYRMIVPGFAPAALGKTVLLARVLIFAQGFFLLSYFSTAVLESLKRFLIPAIAPVFYNLGIILATVFLAEHFQILAPAIGAVFGAVMHFLIQAPLTVHLGFKLQKGLDFSHPGVRKISRLAFPRIIELSFLQVFKSIELYLASMISGAAYTYLTFANSLQLFPVGLFGISLAKASLPSLSYQASRRNKFREVFLSAFNQILFWTIPSAIFLAVLRIPIVRLFFGASRFDWPATVQTSFVLSAFCLGIPAQALIYLLNRAFYAFHQSVTPMLVSIGALVLGAFLGAVFVLIFNWPVWSLALAFSLAQNFQFSLLVFLLFKHRKNFGFSFSDFFSPFVKIFSSAFLSGGLMYFCLKILDRSVSGQRFLFLPKLEVALDTRYTINLIMVTLLTGLLGGLAYILLAWVWRIKELMILLKFFARIEKISFFSRRFWKKRESITMD